MERKERIESLISELDRQYPPDEKFKRSITPTIQNLYDPKIPENQLEKLLELVRETYARHYETKANFESTIEGLKIIAQDLGKIVENYQQQQQNMKEVTKGLKRIAEMAGPIRKQLEESLSTLREAKGTIETSTNIMKQTTQVLETPKTQPPYTNPKKLN